MTRAALLASTAVALCMCAAAATAQAQQKEMDRQGPGGPAAAEPRAQQKEPAPQAQTGEPGQPKAKGATQAEPRDRPTKGTAQAPSPEQGKQGAQTESKKGAAQGAQQTEPKQKQAAPKESQAEPKDKGRAQATPKTDGDSAGAQRSTPGTKGAAGEPKADAPKSAQSPDANRARVQMSEQQRTGFREAIVKDRALNRAPNVHLSLSVGTRVPRSVRLAVLPAAVISLVPEYRSYHYVVIDDRICIVDPGSYEIVEIIDGPMQTAQGGGTTLVLSDDERAIILGEVDMGGGSTLALGGLAEGSDAPRGVELRVFPDRVVERVPRLRGYKFFTAENRIAIIDPQGSKVRLVIDGRR